MKKIILLLCAAMTLTLISCLKDVNGVFKTTYTGYLVDELTGSPLANKKIAVGEIDGYDYDHIDELTMVPSEKETAYTDDKGYFILFVNYSCLTFYDRIVIPSTSTHHGMVMELQGAGKKTYHYGNIQVRRR